MKILIVEDDRMTRRILQKHLGDLGHEVLTATNGAEGWKIFQESEASLVITDWIMPEMNGLQLISKIREINEFPYTYIILLTAKDKKNEIVEGISNGADDYIIKPFVKSELVVRVRAGQRIVELQEKLVNVNCELERMAKTDPLTGLSNRRDMLDRIDTEHIDELETDIPYAFIMVDLDHFKKINDNFGHEAGDYVLKETAARLQSIFRGTDIIARIGGEEFLVIVRNVKFEQAEILAERVRRKIGDEAYELNEGQDVFITCSVGAYWTVPDGDWNTEDFIKTADKAMYISKKEGRNRVTLFNENCISKFDEDSKIKWINKFPLAG